MELVRELTLVRLRRWASLQCCRGADLLDAIAPDRLGERQAVEAGAMDTSAKPRRYEIRIRGVLSETLLGFPSLDARAENGDTVLAGPLPDQAALHGALSQVEDLGLELVEVRRVPAEE